MAIQRLHKNDFYAEGKKRIMSQEEFVKTLQYCFEFINFSCQTEQLTQIFCDIDSKQQGFISYTDYFYFLKEYFGSQSESVEVVRVESVFEEMKRGEKIA
jgi:Ca2+-binding EF-hand superfamily protein